MSRRSNRRSKAKRAQALLSCRAELVLLYDGERLPDHYLECGLTATRELISMKKYMIWNGFTRPSGAVPQSPYQAQLDIAAKQLQQDIDNAMLKAIVTGSSLDK